MKMSVHKPWQQECEEMLVANVRRILMVLSRVETRVGPPDVQRELKMWADALNSALAEYEMMMQERDQ